MSIYEVPNIEHCDVIPVGSIGYRVNAHEGWYIHKENDPDGVDANGNPTKLYRTNIIVWVDEDVTGLEITAAADLPGNAEISGVGDNNHDVM